MDKVKGFLEVGLNEQDEIVVNHPDLKPDADGAGHIVFSPAQARHLAGLLNHHAAQSEMNVRLRQQAEQRKAAEATPVDRSARVLTNGRTESEMPDYRETDSTGMQKSYVVLSPEERAKGFVRPVRQVYIHTKCGSETRMALSIAETFARDPGFYGAGFCAGCREHFPNSELVWAGTDQQVGS